MSETDIEANGWRQGSLVRIEDIPEILDNIRELASDDLNVIIASQSCDLAQPVDREPNVEILLARQIATLDGNFVSNKNPRKLHLSVWKYVGSEEILDDTALEVVASDRLVIPKDRFFYKVPNEQHVIRDVDLFSLRKWLAARYDRPALPTTFNDLLGTADPTGRKRKKIAKAASAQTSGIYVELNPDRDIEANEKYSVNLLGLALPNSEANLSDVATEIERFKEIMIGAGMDVTSAVRTEDQVSIAMIRRFQRLYFDDISFKNSDQLPIEVDDT